MPQIIVPAVATVAVDTFHVYVLPSVPTASYEAVSHAIRMAAIEFCRKTLIWAQTLPDMVTVADQSAYTPTLPSEAVLHKLLSVSVAGNGLDIKTVEGAQFGDFDEGAFLAGSNNIVIVPTPTTAGLVIGADGVLIPSQFGDTLPELLTEHGEAIGWGALARMQVNKKADWYDQAGAATNADLFKDRISATAARISRGKSSARLRKRKNRSGRFY